MSDPQGQVPQPFVFHMSQMNATQLDGGSVKIVDSTVFNVATEIAVAEVTVEPGAMRELHWHPTQDEWTYYLCVSHPVPNTSNIRLTCRLYIGLERVG